MQVHVGCTCTVVTGRLCVYVYVRTYMHARAEGGKWGEGGERVSGERGTGKDRGSNRLVGGREEREREKADRGCERDSFQSVSLELSGRVSRARREGPEVGPELDGGGGGEGR